MWAGLEGTSESYQVDASWIACGGTGLSSCREFSGECVPNACTDRGKELDSEPERRVRIRRTGREVVCAERDCHRGVSASQLSAYSPFIHPIAENGWTRRVGEWLF